MMPAAEVVTGAKLSGSEGHGEGARSEEVRSEARYGSGD